MTSRAVHSPWPPTVTGAVAGRMRAILAKKPRAATLLWRLGEIVGPWGVRFQVSEFTARAWWDGDDVACARLEEKVDRVAERHRIDVAAISPDGQILYERIVR